MTKTLYRCETKENYAEFRKEIEEKIKIHQLAGEIVPTPEMIKTPEQIAGIREACRINTLVLDEVTKRIKKGMTTEEIDRVVYSFTVAQGAIPAPLNFCGFPKSVCTSINDQVCHGIPDKNVTLRSGDIVNVDVSTIYKGFYGDASRMFEIGRVDKRARDLTAITKECLKRGVTAAKPWGHLGDIGAVISQLAHKHGYSVVEDFGGHGVGIEFHEDPLCLIPGKRYRYAVGSRYDFYDRADDQYG